MRFQKNIWKSAKKAVEVDSRASKLGAGAGFEPATFRL
jgi:hypothetical protein